MIKTMLLTAQLALSPIVGTNGLQPKRLVNPVYGETIDYSVTYNGETYKRMAYLNNETSWRIEANNEDGDAYLSYQGIRTDGNLFLQSNIGTGDESYWFSLAYDGTWSFDEWGTSEGKICVSFYGIESYNDNNKTYYYFEVWGNNETGIISVDTYKWANEKYNYDATRTNSLGGDPQKLSNRPFDGKDGQVIGRHIPEQQPTIENPSIYDNIYNFYYQNLFANEGLDELRAEVGNNSMTMRQWLAHTASIISISLLAAALVVLVIKIFKLIAGSISDIWG